MATELVHLLDTNVLSEAQKPRPNERVQRFLAYYDATLSISVLTLCELRKGAALKSVRDKADGAQLVRWIDGIETEYVERILGLDGATARIWGELSVGRTRPVVDTLIAATAIRHGLTLVTRNVRDVEGLGVQMVNPWES